MKEYKINSSVYFITLTRCDEVEKGLLTEKEKEILELLKTNLNLSIQEISKTLSISVAAVNGTLRSLKQKGYIKRSDSAESDNWIVLI